VVYNIACWEQYIVGPPN